jgi:small-conductance mechanosensitive channel
LAVFIKRGLPIIADKLPGKFRYSLLPFGPVLRIFIIATAILVIVPMIIRPTLQNLVAIFATVGLALGFAFKDLIASIIAGIIAVYEQPYRVGDRVTIDDIYGEVKSINLRSLKVVTNEDTAVTIPHSKIFNSNIQNANDGCREQMCVTEFYTNHDVDAVKIRAVLRDVVLASPYTLFSKPVCVSLREKAWGILFKVKAYPVDGRDEFAYISELTVKGRQALMQLGAKPPKVGISLNEND